MKSGGRKWPEMVDMPVKSVHIIRNGNHIWDSCTSLDEFSAKARCVGELLGVKDLQRHEVRVVWGILERNGFSAQELEIKVDEIREAKDNKPKGSPPGMRSRGYIEPR